MAIEIRTWDSQEDFLAWLNDFPKRYGITAQELYGAYCQGEYEDDGDVWEWAQFWGHELAKAHDEQAVARFREFLKEAGSPANPNPVSDETLKYAMGEITDAERLQMLMDEAERRYPELVKTCRDVAQMSDALDEVRRILEQVEQYKDYDAASRLLYSSLKAEEARLMG